MKKPLILLIVSILIGNLGYAQQLTISVDIFAGPSGNPVKLHPVKIEIIPDTNIARTIILTRVDTNGNYIDTIPHPGDAIVIYSTLNCDGTYVFGRQDTVDINDTLTTQVFTINCPAAPGSCLTDFSFAPGGGSLSYLFADASTTISTVASVTTYKWTFGDGDSSSLTNPSHTYNQSGSYTVCLTVTTFDSTFQYITCSETKCRVITTGQAGQCFAGFDVSRSAINPFLFNFSDTSRISGYQNYTLRHEWDFGDGNTDTGSNVQHAYNSAGIFIACLRLFVLDTGNFDTLCMDSVCATININPNPTCKADYIIDSVNSYTGTVYIWNMTFPLDSTVSIAYLWDFGDGSTSSNAYPVHSYINAGMYNVCLTVNEDSCSDTFCDSLGVDSLGRLIHKTSSAGWVLNVLNPTTIGITENTLQDVKVYPNPSIGILKLRFGGLDQPLVRWNIKDIKGAVLKKGILYVDDERDRELDLNQMKSGLYILTLENNNSVYHSKLKIDR